MLCEIRDLAYAGREALLNDDFDEFGRILHHGWEVKKQLASKVSNTEIVEMYEAAVKQKLIIPNYKVTFHTEKIGHYSEDPTRAILLIN